MPQGKHRAAAPGSMPSVQLMLQGMLGYARRKRNDGENGTREQALLWLRPKLRRFGRH